MTTKNKGKVVKAWILYLKQNERHAVRESFGEFIIVPTQEIGDAMLNGNHTYQTFLPCTISYQLPPKSKPK